ncbi:hypothetical protein NSQ96_09665 [Caldifermentibacillus hisashii]|uniref:hypothetical protein n=1 Tax=Caldifermentibacillus hisashii TaxID=996558 RepID=UPI0031FCCC48
MAILNLGIMYRWAPRINLFCFTIHQRPTDTRCFIPHMDKLAATSLPMPKSVIADAGYGSEETMFMPLGKKKSRDLIFLFLVAAITRKNS